LTIKKGGKKMKLKLERKELKSSGFTIIDLGGVSNFQNLFKDFDSGFYTASKLGWDCDIWIYWDEQIIFTRGYRSFGFTVPSVIEKKYNNNPNVTINDFIKDIKNYIAEAEAEAEKIKKARKKNT